MDLEICTYDNNDMIFDSVNELLADCNDKLQALLSSCKAYLNEHDDYLLNNVVDADILKSAMKKAIIECYNDNEVYDD